MMKSQPQQPEMIADFACHTGEGPLWHPEQRKLFWVDIPQGRLFSYDPADGSSRLVYEDRPIGGYTIQADGTLLCFRDRGNVVVLDCDGQVIRTVIDEIPELVSTRFNDVIAAPDGSVFAGTMSSDVMAGRLYHVQKDGCCEVVLDKQGTPNGMGFSPDNSTMYYQDSHTRQLWRFAYAGGRLTGQTLLRTATDHDDPGRGDGMTVDGEGMLWSARWEGGCLLRCDPEGTPMTRYDLPAHCVTCVTFGGPDWTDMFITTANGDKRPGMGSLAGALFHLNLGVKGRPEFRSAF